MARATPTILTALASLALLAGCGESGQSASGSSTAPAAEGTHEHQTSSTPADTQPQQTPTTSTGTGTTAPSSGGESSSSGGAPAFVEPEKSSGGLAGAQATLRAHGFTAVETSTYKPQQTLRVLVGSGSGGENAFFFIGDRYIGTDSKTPSTHVAVVAQHEGAVTLRYTLFNAGQPAGSATVTFQLENGSLQAQQQIPAPAARTQG